MRCIVGLVLFLVLYFGTCSQLDDVVAAVVQMNDASYSPGAAQAVGAGFVKKYHAVVAVAAGFVALLGCALPHLLSRGSEADAWSRYDQAAPRGSASGVRTLVIILLFTLGIAAGLAAKFGMNYLVAPETAVAD